eukprot:CAMPEP_0183707840 /NCGR_PEP_ID=MMETSP0737-20130205/4279_1 /TAXON_ID=385413 /ORGANISM="Thalassiosira miniscula, Strain CCMP1093" /LENGTH=820 /DNA_ID=CAMNT_0025935571 /DNA_START=148 /DNA_END=2610 /DNA_ORIENTATION=+
MNHVYAILMLEALAFHFLVYCAAAAATTSTSPAGRKLNTPGDGDLRFHQTTFLTAHNAHAALAISEGILQELGSNQDEEFLFHLRNNGIRGLLLDVMLNDAEEERLRLVHASSIITLDYGGFRTGLGRNLIPFLEENENAIISIFLETDGDTGANAPAVRGQILAELQSVLSTMTVKGVPLKEMTFKYNHEFWKNHNDWPRLDEIRRSGQRLFIFTDRSEIANEEYGIMYNRDVMQENDFDGIDDCGPRYMWRSEKVSLSNNDYWTRLFFMNHFCCGSGPDSNSKKESVGQNLIGGGNNGWGRLYPRIQQCMSANGGVKPNFIALDWVSQSKEAKEIKDFLNFGGRIGTGQACELDSQCATKSCNGRAGICQCEACPYDGAVDVCLGCESGQYCFSTGGGILNTCRNKQAGAQMTSPTAGTQTRPPPSSKPSFSPSLSPSMTQTPSESPSNTNLPSESPTESGSEKITQYCGEDWFWTEKNCNEAIQCPGGNDDCPSGLTCFASVDCTPAPTLSPRPSSNPSSKLDQALKPILIPTPSSPGASVGGTDGSSGGEMGVSTNSNTNFCGTDFFETQTSCQDAVPCPGPNGNSKCSYLGPDYTCFSNIACGGSIQLPTSGWVQPPTAKPVSDQFPATGWVQPPTKKPTQRPIDSWWMESSNTKLESPSDVPSQPPSLRPTKKPFDFSNKYFCGANYTDAEKNCYYREPCPTGSPTVCNGQQCYSGIICSVPPSTSPSSYPSFRPSRSLGKAPTFNGMPGSPSNIGNRPNGGQTQTDPWANQPPNNEPFDMESFQNRENNGVSIPTNKIVGLAVIAAGVLGLLF